MDKVYTEVRTIFEMTFQAVVFRRSECVRDKERGGDRSVYCAFDFLCYYNRESGWRSSHQSRLPPQRPGIESARGLRFVDLNLTPRVFLRLLRFSSLWKFDFHAKI